MFTLMLSLIPFAAFAALALRFGAESRHDWLEPRFRGHGNSPRPS